MESRFLKVFGNENIDQIRKFVKKWNSHSNYREDPKDEIERNKLYDELYMNLDDIIMKCDCSEIKYYIDNIDIIEFEEKYNVSILGRCIDCIDSCGSFHGSYFLFIIFLDLGCSVNMVCDFPKLPLLPYALESTPIFVEEILKTDRANVNNLYKGKNFYEYALLLNDPWFRFNRVVDPKTGLVSKYNAYKECNFEEYAKNTQFYIESIFKYLPLKKIKELTEYYSK